MVVCSSPKQILVQPVQFRRQASQPSPAAAGPLSDGSQPHELEDEDKVNGQPLAIDELQQLSPGDRETVRRSDEAFVQVRQTWERWKAVRAGLVVLRNSAMRETGSTSVMSKRYRDRFHALLEQRPYAKMRPSTRKALLKCAELSSELDEWHDHLDEDRRLRLNHPASVLQAFLESQKPKPTRGQSRQTRHEAELEAVRQEAAIAISSRDAIIKEQQQQTGHLAKHADTAMEKETDGDIEGVVQYVIARCGGKQQNIQRVIDCLTACVQRCQS
jgi:hypothetical protein